MWRGEIALAKERAEAMLEIAEEHGFQIWESLGTMLLGSTLITLGQQKEGLEKIEQGFASYQGLKTPPVFYPQLIGMRAVAYAQVGQPSEGLKLVDDLIKGMDEERLLRDLPPLLLLKGELLMMVSPENSAESADIFRAILAGTGHVGGKIVDLQAATRLCKLEMEAGIAEESGRVLAELYDSFTEGFETADLRAAKSVLEEWRVSNL